MNAEEPSVSIVVVPVGKPLTIWHLFELIKKRLTPFSQPVGNVLPTKMLQVGRKKFLKIQLLV